MKKNSFMQITMAIILVVSSTASCNKETPIAPKVVQKSNAAHVAASAQIAYTACGMSLNVYNPDPKTFYSFADNYNGTKRPFGIDNFGYINFTFPDKFLFEFAGYYADVAQTVKLWRIKRKDGKYLTFETAGTGSTDYNAVPLAYKEKISGTSAQQALQWFVVSSSGNGMYELVMPKLTVCTIVNIISPFFSTQKMLCATNYGEYNIGTHPIAMIQYLTTPPDTR